MALLDFTALEGGASTAPSDLTILTTAVNNVEEVYRNEQEFKIRGNDEDEREVSLTFVAGDGGFNYDSQEELDDSLIQELICEIDGVRAWSFSELRSFSVQDYKDAVSEASLSGLLAGADQVLGSPEADRLLSFDGDDRIEAGDGEDSVEAGNGDDTVEAGADNDILRGDQGNDLLRGDGGNDQLDGGEGNDTLAGGEDADLYVDQQGTNTFVTAPGASPAATDVLESDGVVQTLSFAGGVDLIRVENFSSVEASFVQYESGGELLTTAFADIPDFVSEGPGSEGSAFLLTGLWNPTGGGFNTGEFSVRTPVSEDEQLDYLLFVRDQEQDVTLPGFYGTQLIVVDVDNILVDPGTPQIQVLKSSDGVVNEGGDSQTYTYAVSNVGEQAAADPLTLTALVDDNGTPADTTDDINILTTGTFAGGDDNGNELIDDGETWLYTLERFVTLNTGESETNTVTATGEDDEAVLTTDQDTNTVTAQNLDPELQVVKSSDGTVNEGGDFQTYTYALSNLSAAAELDPLLLTALVDDNGTPDDTTDDIDILALLEGGGQTDVFAEFLGGDDNDNGLIDAGETWLYTLERFVDLAAFETETNTVTAIAEDDEGIASTDTDTDTVIAEDVLAIDVEKTSDGVVDEGGDFQTYTYALTNVSEDALSDPLDLFSLVDDNGTPGDTTDDIDILTDELATFIGGDDIIENGLIDAGETWVYELVRFVELNAGETETNTVTAIAENDQGIAADTDTDTVTAENLDPAIEVVATASATEIIIGVETVVTFTYALINDSSQAAIDPLTLDSLVETYIIVEDADPDDPVVVVGPVDVDILDPELATFIGGDDGNGLIDAGETWIYSREQAITLANTTQSYVGLATAIGFDDELAQATGEDAVIIDATLGLL